MDDIKKTLEKVVEQGKEFVEEIKLKENFDVAVEKTREAAGVVGRKFEELAQDEELRSKVKEVTTPVVDTTKKVVASLEENETVQRVVQQTKETTHEVVEFVTEKTTEFFEKPEVQEKIENAKDKTIELAEKGLAGLKKWLKPEATGDSVPEDEVNEPVEDIVVEDTPREPQAEEGIKEE